MKGTGRIALGRAEGPDDAERIGQEATAEAAFLLETLEELGFEASFETDSRGDVFMKLEWDVAGVDRLRTRYAGRGKKPLPHGSPLAGMTLAEASAWLAGHSEEEGAEALGGVSRATYYRRRKRLEERAARFPELPFSG